MSKLEEKVNEILGIDKKESVPAEQKLLDLGLTEVEIKALIGI